MQLGFLSFRSCLAFFALDTNERIANEYSVKHLIKRLWVVHGCINLERTDLQKMAPML